MTKSERKALLEGYKSHSVNNEIEILRSKTCGCYFCKKTYSARKVTDWEQGEGGRASAICPECGMTSVIGDASGVPLTKETLSELHKAFYMSETMSKDPEALKDYVNRYLDGKLAHNKKNEDLYVLYLNELALQGDPKAFSFLGDFFYDGAEFQEKSKELAFLFYSKSAVSNDPHCLCRLGRLYNDGFGPKKSKMAGFECFAKAAAFGSLEAAYLLADCYHYGYPVKRDDSFVIRCIIAGMRESYAGVLDAKLFTNNLPEFAYRLAKCLQNGWGIDAEMTLSLKYYLLAQFSSCMRGLSLKTKEKPSYFADLEAQIKSLAKFIGAKTGDPIYDTDTFFDTYGDPNLGDYSKKKFRLVQYSPDSHQLSFEIESEEPGFLFDTANLYCSFNKPTTVWSFTEISSFSQNGESDFDAIVVTETGYQFVRYGEDGVDVVIAEINLLPELDSLSEEEGE